MSMNTVRKGINEIKSGEKIEDKFYMRGRKKATERFPEIKIYKYYLQKKNYSVLTIKLKRYRTI